MVHKKYKTKIGCAIEHYLDGQEERSFCAGDVSRYLEQQGISANTATIYRNLDQLVEEAVLVRFKTANADTHLYRVAGTMPGCREHLHLQCRRCGKIQHVDCGLMREINDRLHSEYGFDLECEISTLSGICADCSRELERQRMEEEE